MIINYILSIILIIRAIKLKKENNLFTIQGLLLIFPIFYLLIPLNIYYLLSNLKIQHILLENINIDLIVYNVNLLLVCIIIISFIKTDKSFNIPKIVVSFKYLLYFLFFMNLIVFLHQLSYTNYSDLINFNRNSLLETFKYYSQNSYVILSRMLLIALTTAYAISKQNINYFIFLSPIFLSDIFILGRTFILMIIMGILSYFYFSHKKINFTKLVFFVLLIFFMRNILINFNFTFDFNQGSFEILGEFMNTFGGILMVANEIPSPNNSLMDYYISSIKPLFFNKFIPIGWPEIDAPAMTINNFFKENYEIYGLAGSIISEMILYKQYNILILLILLIFIYFINFLIKINSFTVKFYYIFILIQVPSIFRWSGIIFLSGNINLLIYLFIPLLLIEYFLLKKTYYKNTITVKDKINDNN